MKPAKANIGERCSCHLMLCRLMLTLDYAHGALFDRHGSGNAFPIPTRWV
jgi:hypothetical protein